MDCNEYLSDDDNLFASEENEDETFVVDFIENELEELDTMKDWLVRERTT